MSGLVISNIHYNLFTQPWLNKKGIEDDIIWDMYVEFVKDAEEEHVPTWEYYIEDENPFNTFYNEVISYLAFEDFHHYQYFQSPDEHDFYIEKYEEYCGKIDEDFIHLFDEMRLALIDTSGKFNHIPIARVW
jgi:hypothetical protein